MATWRREMMESRIKFDDVQKTIYLKALNKKPLKQFAADAAKVHTGTVHEHYKNDPEFADQVDKALARHRDRVIDLHHGLVFEGESFRTFDRVTKEVTSEKKTHPLPLVQMELKHVEPGYNEKSTQDLNISAGEGVIVAPHGVEPMDWGDREKAENKTRTAPKGFSNDK
jgi:hypothetical protein